MKSLTADTPLMQQYVQIKGRHQEEILFFRLGDFYEMFGEDAERSAPILEVALTHRQGVPMCGVPFHAVDRYIAKLLKGGLRVAIAEQLEDPATTKGLVKRDVIRIISSGTLIEENLLQGKRNNYLAALYLEKDHQGYGLATIDISTGEFRYWENDFQGNWTTLINEINILSPAEILINRMVKQLEKVLNGTPYRVVEPRESVQCAQTDTTVSTKNAIAMILTYLERSNPEVIKNLKTPHPLVLNESMQMDKETLENLEILKSLEGSKRNTLLDFLDTTLTPMGGRTLRQWLSRPLNRLEKIEERLNSVEFFVQENLLRSNVRSLLKNCSDLERIAMRIYTERASPRDLIHLKKSLLNLRKIRESFSDNGIKPQPLVLQNLPNKLESLLNKISNIEAITAPIESSILEEPPATLAEGGVIKEGVDSLLDEKRRAQVEGNSWLDELESREKERTNILNLRLGYTSDFGYYLEVTKSHISKVPPHWHRKQTLINTERFTNEELKNLEEKILGAQEQSLKLERALYSQVLNRLKEECDHILEIAQEAAELDCLTSLAETAQLKGLTKPKWGSDDQIVIKEGWHPVVKESLPSGSFVANDTLLNSRDHQIIILTGPNMAGKSTYLRQVALIVYMSQIGSYVSAKEVQLSLVDRIFTRIGSGDRLAQGQSTFMVEMEETSKILEQATNHSLIILDEVGRGTSTYDGISIAWAVIEYLAERKSKVLFATHYFELTQLSKILEKVKNYNVEAKEYLDSVIFLHKISPGPADRSYGIHVAQLAGLPSEVIGRAKKLLEKLELDHKTLLELNRSQVQSQSELNLC